MYNYGSPRVGNMVFVKQFNQLVPVQSHLELQDCPAHGLLRMCAMHVIVATQRRHTCSLRQDAWRVYNARDLVCSVPRMMGFAHVGTPVELCADGTYAVQGELPNSTMVMNSPHACVASADQLHRHLAAVASNLMAGRRLSPVPRTLESGPIL